MRTNDINDIKSHLSTLRIVDDSVPNLTDPTLYLYFDSPRSPQQKYDAYVVTVGRKVGVFLSWLDTKKSTENLPEAQYKGYTLHAALERWKREFEANPKLRIAAVQQLSQAPAMPLGSQPPSTPQRARTQVANTHSASTSHISPRPPPSPSTPSKQADNCVFYVVQRGERPGVYMGRVASWAAAGPDPRAYRFSSASKEDAWETFGQLVMADEIEYL